MTSTEIRAVRLEELPTLLQLAHRSWHDHYPGIITVKQIDYMLALGYEPTVLERELAEGTRIDVLMHGANMIGFMSFGPAKAGNVKLHKCYLDVGAHVKGLGQQMLDHVAIASKDMGAQTLSLRVNKENRKPFRRMNAVVLRSLNRWLMTSATVSSWTTTPCPLPCSA